jgi:hypothetical protein
MKTATRSKIITVVPDELGTVIHPDCYPKIGDKVYGYLLGRRSYADNDRGAPEWAQADGRPVVKVRVVIIDHWRNVPIGMVLKTDTKKAWTSFGLFAVLPNGVLALLDSMPDIGAIKDRDAAAIEEALVRTRQKLSHLEKTEHEQVTMVKVMQVMGVDDIARDTEAPEYDPSLGYIKRTMREWYPIVNRIINEGVEL